MISSMHTCMQKIPGLNEQLFYAKERASNGNLEGPNNESETSQAGQAMGFPSTLEAAAKARRSAYLKGFSPNSIPLTRPEGIKLPVCLSLDTEEAQTFKVFYYLSHRNNPSSDSEQEDPCLQDVLINAAASRTSQ